MSTTATYRYMSIEIPAIDMTCSYAAILATDEEFSEMLTAFSAAGIADATDNHKILGDKNTFWITEYPEDWICKSCELDSSNFATEIAYIEAAMEDTSDSCWAGCFTAAAMIEALAEGRYPEHH